MRSLQYLIGIQLTVLAFLTVAPPAFAQDARRIAKCVTIPNVDERIECLEGRSNVPEPPAPAPAGPRPPLAGPSYDCRMATTSIERAICSDATLSEWDMRMGQQYQLALRQRKGPDYQALVESQRSWIQQRNNACGAVAGNNVWSCIIDMARQRIAVLSEPPPANADPSTTASPSPLPQSPPKPIATRVWKPRRTSFRA